MSDVKILKMPGLVGKTILEATCWSDDTGFSLLLSDGAILQVRATYDEETFEANVKWDVELPVPKYDFPDPDMKFHAQFEAWKKLCALHPEVKSTKEFGDFAVAHTGELMMMARVGGKR